MFKFLVILFTTHEVVLLLVKVASSKSNTLPWVFFTFFKLYKSYQIAQSVSFNRKSFSWQCSFIMLIISKFPIRALGKLSTKQKSITNLFLGDSHLICNIGKHSRLDEIAFVSMSLSSTSYTGTIFFSTLYQSKYFLKLLLVNLHLENTS